MKEEVYEEIEEISDREISDSDMFLFIAKIALLLSAVIIGAIAYGITYCDFTPIVIMGFFVFPVFLGGVKLVWEYIKVNLFEDGKEQPN
uniref:Uncharacterized protein n=1 Tax=virus sp. ctmTa7 TaxID=2828255 RepID=A0A8S5RC77_9VIRU|nr:MAG TPA: hypothetical protein [virus sp. ctmTa7]